MNRRDFQILSTIRLAEAKALHKAGLPSGAYYLSGYAVECALKACIAKGTQRYDFPEKRSVDASYTHNLRDLVRVANLEPLRLEEARRDAEFLNNWDLVQQWSEHSRYGKHDAAAAEALLRAIGGREHGVIRWVKRHW